MSSVNKVMLIGNVGRDPEVRNLQDGGKVVNLSIATSEAWRDKQTGERREKTEWHRVVIFNPGLAEIAERYLRKGSKVYLEGALQTRKWTDQSGAEKYTTEIVLQKFRGQLVLLGDRTNMQERGSGDEYEDSVDRLDQGRQSGGSQSRTREPDFLDDEIPF